MDLKSLTYTSLAKLDLDAGDVEAIHRTAREVNALEGITGLLIFNGTHFLQRLLRSTSCSSVSVGIRDTVHLRSATSGGSRSGAFPIGRWN